MNKNLGVYSPDKVDVIISARNIQGFAEDEMVRTDRLDENEYSVRVGAKGEYSFQKNLNKAGNITISLKQLSPSNKFLQTLKEAGTVFSAVVRAKHNYTELVQATNCMIGIAPRKTMGKEETDREWNIVAGELIETDK